MLGAPTAAGAGTDATLVNLPAAPAQRSPAPFVAVGLLMVTATLSTICVKRRMALAAPVPAAAAPASAPAGRRQLERSLG